MKFNLRKPTVKTHEGASAFVGKPINQLRRTVLSCLLWEDNFYENGVKVHDRIVKLVPECDYVEVADLTLAAKLEYKLRHVPLLLAVELLKHPKRLKTLPEVIERVITRADDLTEILALYWRNGKCPIAKALKKALARAFNKFDAYALGKYNRDGAIKLRDVLFLCHAKPGNEEDALIWKKLVDGVLESPDTWEVNLSAGKDKKTTFERLLSDNRIGGLALIRNLRNMAEASVDYTLVKQALRLKSFTNILPFQFLAAVKAAPMYAEELDAAMLKAIDGEKFEGQTAILIDCSGSMSGNLSKKSTMTRNDAASALAILARELCRRPRIFCFGSRICEIPGWSGLALKQNIERAASLCGGGTEIGRAVEEVVKAVSPLDRIILVTDEQSHDEVKTVMPPATKRYILNVGAYSNGVATANHWVRIDGFSEASLKYIQFLEKENEL